MEAPSPLGSLGKVPREVRDAIYSHVFRVSYQNIEDYSERHMTDWRTLSILRTSKLIHLEASEVLYARSHFRVSIHGNQYHSFYQCSVRLSGKQPSSVILSLSYADVCKLRPEGYKFSPSGYETIFRCFAKLCRTEKMLKKFTVRLQVSAATVLSTVDGDLGGLEKLGPELTRFLGVQEIIVELVYSLCKGSWSPGTEPTLSARALLGQLKPLFGSYAEDTEVSHNQFHLQRSIFRDPAPSQEGKLVTIQASATLDGEGGPKRRLTSCEA